jgi:DNA polymerase-4
MSGLADYAQGDLVAELARYESEAHANDLKAEPGDDGERDNDGDNGSGSEQAGPEEAVPAVTLYGPVPTDHTARRWLAGQDVRHATRGAGWVQGAGVGRVTVRFEGPGTEPGRIGTFWADDPDLEPVEAVEIAREALAALAAPIV